MSRKPSHRLVAVVMAAGRGKRLKSRLPKVLHDVCGRPVLWHVLRAAIAVRPEKLVVVVNHERNVVEDAVASWDLGFPVEFVNQEHPQGTGHAIMVAEKAVGRAEEVLVLPGDNPLITPAMLRNVLRVHRRRRPAATVLTAELADGRGYGRVLREGDRFLGIVEEREANGEQRRIKEIATSVYAFRREDLYRALPAVGRENKLREYYLPDVLGILRDKGEDIRAVLADFGGALDVNSRSALAAATAVMRRWINEGHMDHGVTLVDPERTYIDAGVKIGRDTVIHPLTFLAGDTRIGEGCQIGPATRAVDSRIEAGAVVQFSVLQEARVGREALVGPYAHLRPGARLRARAKAGTFVEIKASTVGEGSKVPHLSYVGDTRIGRDVNVGAATVTCNYDGYEKYGTVIDDEVLIGSDTMLVAPVRVGRRAVTGAGSVISKDVPAGALGVERAEQRTVRGYRDRKDAEARRKRGKGRKR
jgi:bifunctional UDP-N-acetylglucosamine pyrophosphorylase/glucosamine-1-phosphate N-acetyltransferase